MSKNQIVSKALSVDVLELNSGQMYGLPKNPRFIRDERFESLKKSIEDAPEMLGLRELLVYPLDMENSDDVQKYIIIGGNMRYRACTELGYKEIPCKIIPKETPVKKLREYTIKDNESFGNTDWDIIANEWDTEELQDWGMDLPDFAADYQEPEDGDMSATEALSELKYEPIYYEPKEIPNIKLADCLNLEKFNAKVAALDDYNLTDKQRETLKMFAYRFIKIDFEAVANYYSFNASEEEQKAIERLRLVLTDDGLRGFISDDMLKVTNMMVEQYKDNDNETDD